MYICPLSNNKVPYMKVLAIDPGNIESGFVIWDGDELYKCGIVPNNEIISLISDHDGYEYVLTEYMMSMGMAVGSTVFDTQFWCGRFYEHAVLLGKQCFLIKRMDVKMHHCQNPRAKDTNIRQALINKYGQPGNKKQPGTLYGIKSHMWSAIAIATYATETNHFFNHYKIK